MENSCMKRNEFVQPNVNSNRHGGLSEINSIKPQKKKRNYEEKEKKRLLIKFCLKKVVKK